MNGQERNSIWVLCVLPILGVWTACPSKQRNPRLSKKLYWLGQDYYVKAMKQRNLAKRDSFMDEAFENTKKAVRADPGNYKAWNLLGYLYLYKADQELGLVEVAQCLPEGEGQDARARADALFRLAEKAFHAALRKHRYCTNPMLGVVSVLLHFKKYEEAVRRCKQVVEILSSGRADPTCSNHGDKAVALGNMGWAYYNLRRYVLAERSLRQALVLAPKFYLGRYWLGRLLYETGRTKEAVEQLRRTVTEFGLPQAAWQYYGLALAKAGRSDEARKAFRRCVDFAPRSCAAKECRRYLKLLSSPGGRASGGEQ